MADQPEPKKVAPATLLGRKRQKNGVVLGDHRPQLENISRRLFFRQGLSLGALAMLSGCNLQDDTAVDKVLWAMSRWNDRVQALLFDRNRLAPTYRPEDITDPFPFNAFYPEDSAPEIDLLDYRLQVSGLVDKKASWSLDDLRRLPQVSQITQHICIEGWSAIGEWRGAPLSAFLQHVGADMTAKYVGFKCADRYYSSIDMPTAMHPQTILALDFGKNPLPLKYGSPMKLRVPTKLGFKNPKHIVEVFVANDYPGGYWEDQGYNWFSGL
ncbi:molybdopterin-dependent oxidoreductase [Rhizobium leguminosarum]|nr:molybdopterin-dependent oxidoreductase [Rhizobium leguminosarum]MBY5737686.1 molybdopterin-dependent oxidoreductase [Rhizobium leguminosarum]